MTEYFIIAFVSFVATFSIRKLYKLPVISAHLYSTSPSRLLTCALCINDMLTSHYFYDLIADWWMMVSVGWMGCLGLIVSCVLLNDDM